MTGHLHWPTDNDLMLTRSRSDLRAQLSVLTTEQAPVSANDGGALETSPAKPGSQGASEADSGGTARHLGLAPHVDRSVKLDFTFLLRQAQQLDADRARRLMAVAEKRIPRRADTALARRLARLSAGDTAMVPFFSVRPGQAQLSFMHAGTKVAKFLGKLAGHTPADLMTLTGELGLLEVPCLVGPKGRYVVMHDRHHHMSGLLALIGWTDQLTNSGHALHMGKPGPELATLQALFGGVPQLQIKVTENLAHLSEAEFATAAQPYLHRQTRSGGPAEVLPARMTALDDNPFRYLASQTKIKVERTGDGKRDFELEARSNATALWIKPPSAPDFVEFYVGRIFEAALQRTGRGYDPTEELSPGDLDLLRNALITARQDPDHPSHEVLQSIVIKPADVSVEGFADHIKVGRKRGHVRLK